MDADTLKPLFRMAKNKPLNFAFGADTKPEKCKFVVDKKRPADRLYKEMRSKDGFKRVAYGTFTASSGLLKLECKRIVPNLDRLLMKHAKHLGLPKITVEYTEVKGKKDSGDDDED